MVELAVPADHDEMMWGLDLTGTRRNWAWWWWWWLFLFKDGKSKRPRQLMVLWSGKTADKVKVRDHTWKKKYDPRTGSGRVRFHGLVCSWFYDGKTMHDPLFIVDTPISAWQTKKGGGLTGVVEKDYSFYGRPEHYTVALRNEGIDATFRLTPVNRDLSSPVHRKTERPFGMSYEIYKHPLYDFEGEILAGGKFEPIRGTAYFQKVLVNSPALPWYWGMFHTDAGYYIDYMMPHLGLQVLRSSRSHSKGPDGRPFFISPSLEFYDPVGGGWTKFERVGIEKRYSKNLPVFTVQGRTGDASIQLQATAYSRAHWRFLQNDRRSRVFYYNEYPARLTGFKFKKGRRTVELADLGQSRGNCEHSWGRLY